MYDITGIRKDLKTDYFLQDDVCRLCWNRKGKSELIHIQFDSKEIDCSSEIGCTVYVIKDCLDIDIGPKSRPNQLCKLCTTNITKFSNFKSFCKETDKRLQRIFENCDEINYNSLKIEVNDIILKEEPNASQSLDGLQQSSLLASPSDDDVPLDKIRTRKNNKTKVKLKKTNEKLTTFCTICCQELQTKESMTIHNSEIHNIVDNSHKCFGCDLIFKTRGSLSKHEQLQCEGLKNGFKCKLCDQILLTHKAYDSHLRSHQKNVNLIHTEKIFKCKRCLETFKTKELLKNHSKCHTLKKKKYICEHCGRIFTRQDYLHKHKMIHTGRKQHSCPHCDFRTVQRSSLTIHIRKHSGERPYQCTLCPQRCVSSSNLLAHLRRHDPANKHFQCKICDKKFGYKVSLDEHVNVAHELQSRTFTCSDCGSVYSRARGLRQHVRKKHASEKSNQVVGAVGQSGSAVCQSGSAFFQSGSAFCQSGSAVCQSGSVVCQSEKEKTSEVELKFGSEVDANYSVSKF